MRISAGTGVVAGLVAAALLCVITGLLPRADAGALGERIAPVLGFVIAITVVAELARDAAVFDVVSQRLARWGRGRVLVRIIMPTLAVILGGVVLMIVRAILGASGG